MFLVLMYANFPGRVNLRRRPSKLALALFKRGFNCFLEDFAAAMLGKNLKENKWKEINAYKTETVSELRWPVGHTDFKFKKKTRLLVLVG